MNKELAAKVRPGDPVVINGSTEGKITKGPVHDGDNLMFEVDVPGWFGLPPYSHKELTPPDEETETEWKTRE